MYDYQTLYEQKKSELSSDFININEVDIDEIKKRNPNTDGGFICSTGENDAFNKIEILIDKALQPNIKICIMFHEYGHALHHIKLAPLKIEQLKIADVDGWVILDEYEAFHYQLNEIKKIINADNSAMLRDLMEDLNNKKTNCSDNRYKAALNKLALQPIWQECLELVG